MPARSAVVPRWATGCNVKPKQVHTTARPRMIPQSLARTGMAGSSNMNAAAAAQTAMVQTWAMPMARGSPPEWLMRSVVMMAQAYRSEMAKKPFGL